MTSLSRIVDAAIEDGLTTTNPVAEMRAHFRRTRKRLPALAKRQRVLSDDELAKRPTTLHRSPVDVLFHRRVEA